MPSIRPALVVTSALAAVALAATSPWLAPTERRSVAPAPPQEAAVAARPAPQVRQPDAAPAPTAPASPMAGGMVVGVDPETGELGLPTPAQREELSRARAQSLQALPELREVRHPEGHYSFTTDERFDQFTVVGFTADGARVTGCAQGPAAAARLVSDSLALRPAREVK